MVRAEEISPLAIVQDSEILFIMPPWARSHLRGTSLGPCLRWTCYHSVNCGWGSQYPTQQQHTAGWCPGNAPPLGARYPAISYAKLHWGTAEYFHLNAGSYEELQIQYFLTQRRHSFYSAWCKVARGLLDFEDRGPCTLERIALLPYLTNDQESAYKNPAHIWLISDIIT